MGYHLLCRLVLHIMYYPYSSIHTYSSQCGSWLSVMGKVGSGMPSSSSHSSSSISTFDSARGWCNGILTYQSVSGLLHLGESITSGILVIEHFQPSLEVSGELCISISCISSWVLPKFLVERVMGQSRPLIIGLPIVFNTLEDVPHWCSIVKDVIRDVSIAQVLKDPSSQN